MKKFLLLAIMMAGCQPTEYALAESFGAKAPIACSNIARAVYSCMDSNGMIWVCTRSDDDYCVAVEKAVSIWNKIPNRTAEKL